jgi:hypothetical protein
MSFWSPNLLYCQCWVFTLLIFPETTFFSSTREPDYEDNEEQAALRETRAQAVAVDPSWVIGESLRPTYVRV